MDRQLLTLIRDLVGELEAERSKARDRESELKSERDAWKRRYEKLQWFTREAKLG